MITQENILYTADEIKAMEKTCEKYNQALERARKELQEFKNKDCDDTTRRTVINIVCNLFPELPEESEDERIRRGIIRNLQFLMDKSEGFVKEDLQERIAWLEKQGEQQPVSVTDEWIEDYWQHHKVINPYSYDKGEEIQFDHRGFVGFCKKYCKKPADKVEPKFHEGDWIISNNKKSIYQVIEVKRGIYVIRDNVDNHEYYIGIEECEKSGRLWSINDAKDGDVLVGKGGRPFIFTGEFDVQDDNPIAYCGINSNDKFITGCGSHWTFKDGVKPATKEQRDLLFEKMRNAGYMWDSEKKELKKIEHKALNADEVIEWIRVNVPIYGNYMMIDKFKKDFGL